MASPVTLGHSGTGTDLQGEAYILQHSQLQNSSSPSELLLGDEYSWVKQSYVFTPWQ